MPSELVLEDGPGGDVENRSWESSLRKGCQWASSTMLPSPVLELSMVHECTQQARGVTTVV